MGCCSGGVPFLLFAGGDTSFDTSLIDSILSRYNHLRVLHISPSPIKPVREGSFNYRSISRSSWTLLHLKATLLQWPPSFVVISKSLDDDQFYADFMQALYEQCDGGELFTFSSLDIKEGLNASALNSSDELFLAMDDYL